MFVFFFFSFLFFFFNDTATTEIYTLSLHDALPISVDIQSGNDGTGNVSIAGGVFVSSDDITLRAGNGNGGTTTAIVDLTNNPTFRGSGGGASSPVSFALRQDAAISDGDIPATARFGGGVSGMSYTLRSDDGTVTVSTAGNVAGSGLVLQAADGVTTTSALTLNSLSIAADLDTDGVGNVILGDAIDTSGSNGAFSSTGVGFDSTGAAITTGNGALNINHSGAVTIGEALSSGTGTMTVRAGNDGTGDLAVGNFGLTSNNITLWAGNGTGGGATSALDLSANPTFNGAGGGGTSPTNFTLRQDAALADADIPAAARFGGGVSGMTYSIQSNDSTLTLDTSSKVTNSTLTLVGNSGVTTNAALTLSTFTITGGNVDINNTIDTSGSNGNFTSTGGDFDNTGGAITTGTGSLNITHRDRKSTRLNSSHTDISRMPSSA